MQYNKIPILALLAREILPVHHARINSQESNDGWFRKLQPASLSQIQARLVVFKGNSIFN